MKAVNLIPGEQRQGAGSITGRSGGGALIVLGLIAGLAALVAMYGSAHHRISSQTGEVASLTAQANAIQARAGRLTPYTSFVAMADQRTQTVAQLVQARFDWSHALHELGRVLPAAAALSALHGTVGPAGATSGSGSATSAAASAAGGTGVGGTGAGGTPSSSTPPGSTPVFTLTGCATSQSEVAQSLQRLRLMDGASEVQLQSSTKSGSGGSSGSSGTGGCPAGDPTFTAQIIFTGLPAAPAPSAPTGTSASTVAAHGGGKTEQVSTHGKAVPR
jgi:Tfp pilus assembly protein PilN